MSYTAPSIDESGYHYPSYQEILTGLVEDVQAICGQDVYLGSDSMDYQLISIFALKIYDCYQAVEIAYNSHSPVTAIGTGLDYIVALNGISRIQGTQSVVNVELTGTAGQIIKNGKVSDINGVLWDLPETVTIGADGKVTAEATCENVGITIAEPDTITRIMTPTSGWISVTNHNAATTGTVTESDSHLRARQALTTSAVSRSILGGLKGALLEITDVTHVDVIENDTNIDHGAESDIVYNDDLPPHSICCLVRGGDNAAIAKTILLHKSCGCATHGTESVSVTDSTNQQYTIKFSRPTAKTIHVKVQLTALSSYSTAYREKIQTAINDYIKGYSIGKDFVTSMLWGIVQSTIEDTSNPPFYITSITAGLSAESLSTANVSIDYDEYAEANVEEIKVVDGRS